MSNPIVKMNYLFIKEEEKDDQGIVEVVRKLALVSQTLAENRNIPHSDSVGEMFKKVAQSKPLLYQGESDLSIIEIWLREFDKLFN